MTVNFTNKSSWGKKKTNKKTIVIPYTYYCIILVYKEHTFIYVIWKKTNMNFLLNYSYHLFVGKRWNANMVAYWTWTNSCFCRHIDCVEQYNSISHIIGIDHFVQFTITIDIENGLKYTYLYYRRLHTNPRVM